MTHLYTYLDPILARAAMLSLALILAACGIGELLARGPFADLVAAGHRFVEQLGHKLDREGRKPAILIYRGIIAFFILTLPCVAIGMALERLGPWRELVIFVFFLLWFGHNLQFIRLVALWRRGEREGLPLEIPGVDFLFADSHAVIRYLIETRLTYFAIYLVGASFWYALFGLPLALSYMVLACAAQAYHPRRVFGWAIRNLFQLMDAIPQCIARVLLTLAALFTPQARPKAGLEFKPWRFFIASLLAVVIGGPSPLPVTVWAGSGIARVVQKHLRRLIHLLLVATLLLALLLVGRTVATMLNFL